MIYICKSCYENFVYTDYPFKDYPYCLHCGSGNTAWVDENGELHGASK